MLDVLRSPTFVKLAASAFAVGTCVLLVMALFAFVRLGRPKSDRRTFSDLPDLVHGPQELPDQSDSRNRERPSHLSS